LVSYSDFRMRSGLAYNEKPDATPASDAYAEWDDPSTIDAVDQALGLFGTVVRLEADEFFPQKLSLARPDIVFNMAEGLHGPCRESHVPALCEYLDIPYTGSDPLTLALTLHKGRTKEILAYRGVPTAPFRVIERVSDLERMPLPYPLFVKPVAEGSGKGIFVNNLCESPAQLAERVPFLLDRYAQAVLVETYLPGPAMNSCFPKAARAAGYGYDELIQEVVRIAWKRITGREAGALVGAQHAAPLPAPLPRDR